MTLYKHCNATVKEYMFGRWHEYTCKNKVFSGRCSIHT